MKTVSEVLIHPYGADRKSTVLHVLIREFSSNRWTSFDGAVHFVKESGHYDALIASLRSFLEAGRSVRLTFGADVFGRTDAASESAAVERLLLEFERFPDFRVYLYHEKGRTFHPKLFLFSNVAAKKALLIVGSSNWSEGGFVNNVEVSVSLELNLKNAEHAKCYDELATTIKEYWQEAE